MVSTIIAEISPLAEYSSGHGIINASGEIWKAQRKAGLKFFSGTNLEFMVEDVLPDAYSKMKLALDKAIDDKATVDMQKLFLDLTTSVVGQMAYDASSNSIKFSSLTDCCSEDGHRRLVSIQQGI